MLKHQLCIFVLLSEKKNIIMWTTCKVCQFRAMYGYINYRSSSALIFLVISTVEPVLYGTCYVRQPALYGITFNSYYSIHVYLQHIPPNVA